MLSLLCSIAFITCSSPPPVIIQNAVITAYTASADETDSSPLITASGLNLEGIDEAIIANNCLPFGTIVQIDGVGYSVQDRLNARYDCRHFDILMKSKQKAKSFGRQNKEVKIYETD